MSKFLISILILLIPNLSLANLVFNNHSINTDLNSIRVVKNLFPPEYSWEFMQNEAGFSEKDYERYKAMRCTGLYQAQSLLLDKDDELLEAKIDKIFDRAFDVSDLSNKREIEQTQEYSYEGMNTFRRLYYRSYLFVIEHKTNLDYLTNDIAICKKFYGI